MIIKEFLKPEWKKAILPAILVIAYLIILSSFYSIGAFTDEFYCSAASMITDMRSLKAANDSLRLNETNSRLTLYLKQANDDRRMGYYRRIEPLANAISFLNPIVPLPCELSGSDFCRYYVTRATFDCMRNLTSIRYGNILIMMQRDYREVSFPDIGFASMLLIAEGYLISSFIAMIMRKEGKKKSR